MYIRHHLVASCIVVIGIVGVFLFVAHEREDLESALVSSTQSSFDTTTDHVVPNASSTPHTEVASTSPVLSSAVNKNVGNVSFAIEDTVYSVPVPQTASVIEVMRILESRGDIRFVAREYPSLGLFINSIQGKENADGKYWVFYVNGISATQGVSSMNVHPGDSIEWKYRARY